jgi:hypothetical protein
MRERKVSVRSLSSSDSMPTTRPDDNQSYAPNRFFSGWKANSSYSGRVEPTLSRFHLIFPQTSTYSCKSEQVVHRLKSSRKISRQELESHHGCRDGKNCSFLANHMLRFYQYRVPQSARTRSMLHPNSCTISARVEEITIRTAEPKDHVQEKVHAKRGRDFLLFCSLLLPFTFPSILSRAVCLPPSPPSRCTSS